MRECNQCKKKYDDFKIVMVHDRQEKDYYPLCADCLEAWIEKKMTGVVASYVIGIIIAVIVLINEGGLPNGVSDLYGLFIFLIIPYSLRHLFKILTSLDGWGGEVLFFGVAVISIGLIVPPVIWTILEVRDLKEYKKRLDNIK